MPSRPQFSLRVLFIVTAMVCLASATVAELPEEQTFATTAQGVLRLVLCIVLPAMLIAGAVAKRGYERTMYIGGLFAASIPLLRACVWFHTLLERRATKEEDSETVLFRHNAKKLWLFASVLVCLAAMAIIELPGEQRLAAIAQGAIQMAMCIMLPAILLAGVVVTRGYARTLCIGGLFAASVPLAAAFDRLFWMIADLWLQTVWEPLDMLEHRLWFRPFAVMWALAPCASYACFLVHRLWRQADEARETTALSVAQIESRAALTAVAAGFAATAAIGIQSHGLFADVQKPLMIGLKVVFPALLVIGAVEGTGRFRLFCIGAALPATLALAWLCIWLGRTVYYFDSAADWSSAVACLTQQRYSTAALWACAPPFGMACVFFDWLFERCKFF